MTQTEGVDEWDGVQLVDSFLEKRDAALPAFRLAVTILDGWVCWKLIIYETGLSNHEPLCHLRGSASGRTVLCFWDSPAVPHTPSPCTVPECPRPATTRPRPHVATTATPSGH